jgi:hypothetical protein
MLDVPLFVTWSFEMHLASVHKTHMVPRVARSQGNRVQVG